MHTEPAPVPDEKHRRKLASAGATALETGPQESALLLGGALLSSMGMPAEEVVKSIEPTPTPSLSPSPSPSP